MCSVILYRLQTSTNLAKSPLHDRFCWRERETIFIFSLFFFRVIYVSLSFFLHFLPSDLRMFYLSDFDLRLEFRKLLLGWALGGSSKRHYWFRVFYLFWPWPKYLAAAILHVLSRYLFEEWKFGSSRNVSLMPFGIKLRFFMFGSRFRSLRFRDVYWKNCKVGFRENQLIFLWFFFHYLVHYLHYNCNGTICNMLKIYFYS